MASNGNGTNRRQIRRRRRWIWPVATALLAVGILFALKAALRSNHRIDPAKLAVVTRGGIARSVVATGVIEPRSKVDIKSKASGIVQRLFVDYGDWVRQGQVLAELDKEELKARLREANATLLAAQAAEESAKASHERNKVEAEGPDLPFLRSSLDRARQLHTQGLIAKSGLEDAEKAYRLALNRQVAALRNVAVTRAEIARAAAQVAQAKASLERVEEDLRNATITSPMEGLVLSRDVEVGDAVSSILVLGSQATLIMVLGDVSDVYVLGKVDQADIGKVFLGQRARITVESFKDRRYEGRVTKIAPLGVEKDNVTTFEVRVSIRNPDGELKANMSANAEIILEEKRGVLLVPESAILSGKDRKPFVEVPDPSADQGKRRAAVKLGISNGIKTELIEGPGEGARIVLP